MTQIITNYPFHLFPLKQVSVPLEATVQHFDPTLCGVSVTPTLNIVSTVLLAIGMLCRVHNALLQKADTWPTKRFLVPGAILLLPGVTLWLANSGVDALAVIA